ncbi:MAG: hypothetical protein ACLS6G_12085 [Christensenellales bacterium]
MRKKMITVAATLVLLGLLSMVEQMAVKAADGRRDGAHTGNPVAACAKPDGARA